MIIKYQTHTNYGGWTIVKRGPVYVGSIRSIFGGFLVSCAGFEGVYPTFERALTAVALNGWHRYGR